MQNNDPIQRVKLKDPGDVKLFILYLLKNIGTALDFVTLCEINLWENTVNYFDFTQNFADLLEKGNILEVREDALIKYAISPSGLMIVDNIEERLLNIVKESVMRSARRVLKFKEDGTQIKSLVDQEGDGWRVYCEVRNKDRIVFKTELYCEDYRTADKIRFNFNRRAEDIQKQATALLAGDIDLAL